MSKEALKRQHKEVQSSQGEVHAAPIVSEQLAELSMEELANRLRVDVGVSRGINPAFTKVE